MYFEKDLARGIDGTFMWLMEEVGELAAALRSGTHEERLGEFADVLAWLCTIANVAGVDLSESIRASTDRAAPAAATWSARVPTRRSHEPPQADSSNDRGRLPPARSGCGHPAIGLLAGRAWRSRLRRAQAPEPEISGVRAGFAGHYKLGCWTPVEVMVQGRRTSRPPASSN